MKAILALLVLAASAQANLIPIDPGPIGFTSSDKRINFNDLNGISVSGQSLTLDFAFPQDHFVRLTLGVSSYTILLTFKTNASSLIGFMHGTACLTDSLGNELSAPQTLGSASGDNGIMACGLFPPISILAGGHYGAHFDLDLPSTAYFVTSAEFRIITQGGPFIVGPHVPDSGSTLLLLWPSLGLIALSSWCRYR